MTKATRRYWPDEEPETEWFDAGYAETSEGAGYCAFCGAQGHSRHSCPVRPV